MSALVSEAAKRVAEAVAIAGLTALVQKLLDRVFDGKKGADE